MRDVVAAPRRRADGSRAQRLGVAARHSRILAAMLVVNRQRLGRAPLVAGQGPPRGARVEDPLPRLGRLVDAAGAALQLGEIRERGPADGAIVGLCGAREGLLRARDFARAGIAAAEPEELGIGSRHASGPASASDNACEVSAASETRSCRLCSSTPSIALGSPVRTK